MNLTRYCICIRIGIERLEIVNNSLTLIFLK
ncbi:MAG: hypothetical protein ACI8P3_002959 [Saprospiraceae bacterium]